MFARITLLTNTTLTFLSYLQAPCEVSGRVCHCRNPACFTCRNDESTSVLLLTGTHGDGVVTGLTKSNKLERDFYVSDCKGKNSNVLVDLLLSSTTAGVGVVPRAKSTDIPNIMEIQRAELSDNQDCFYNDPDINQMRIQVRRLKLDTCFPTKYFKYQVTDIGPYHGQEKKLVDDINEV